MRLADVSIRQPVFAVMLTGALVVLGLVSIPRLGVDLWPRIEFPLVTVQTVLRGAPPETMEREVTEVLEEAVNRNRQGDRAVPAAGLGHFPAALLGRPHPHYLLR